MPDKRKPSSAELKKLAKVNQKLQAENSQLKQRLTSKGKGSSAGWWSRSWRTLSIVVLVGVAGAILVAGNLLFWAGRTITSTEHYSKLSSELIRDPVVQDGVSLYGTNQLFSNVDVAGFTRDVLPPRAGFLAEPLASQLKSLTNKTLKQVVANDKFQDTWVSVNTRSHARLLALANSPGGRDGIIDINDIYQQLSKSLDSTRLSFLANKSLPTNIGQFKVANAPQLKTLHLISKNIDGLRTVSLLLLVLLSGLAIWISRNRRRLVISIGILYSFLLVITLLATKLTSSVISGRAQPEYQPAVQRAAEIIMQPLTVQTTTLLFLAIMLAAVAWLSGPYRPAKAVRKRLQDLLEGKLHQSLFPKENGLTRWIGIYKRPIEWISVSLIVIIMISVQLSPRLVVRYGLLMIIIWLIIETLAAPLLHRSNKTR